MRRERYPRDWERERQYSREFDPERDRGWWDRSTDEVRAWFGDDEAERRRRWDEHRPGGRRELGRPYGRPYRTEDADDDEWYGERREPMYDRGERMYRFRQERPERQGPQGWEPWWTHTGQFSGRGPRSYKRSDERILDEVCERLARDPNVDATNIEVIVQNAEVTLRGAVNTREEKRVSEDIVEEIFGVSDVHNQIRVARPGQAREAA